MPLRKLVPFIAAALALAACSSNSITGPERSNRAANEAPHYEGTGMLGGGGRM
jgi:hypothetical protein